MLREEARKLTGGVRVLALPLYSGVPASPAFPLAFIISQFLYHIDHMQVLRCCQVFLRSNSWQRSKRRLVGVGRLWLRQT
jgi:hypothetical protein